MENSNRVIIPKPNNCDIAQIFDCGQCFRFDAESTDPSMPIFSGVAHGKFVRVSQTHGELIFDGINEEEFDDYWKHYFALDADYESIRREISSRFPGDSVMREAMEFGSGIRILRQDPWETVCSFIISQNNNIPRIKKIIEALSRAFGEEIPTDGAQRYSFPSPEALYRAGEDEIFALKTGFRAKYIFDAAKRVSTGELDLEKIKDMPTGEALDTLMTVKGIGLKVASCAALFGLEKTDAFPIDVWVKKVLEKYYPDGLDIASLGKYAGIAQQYLFYYERYRSQDNLGASHIIRKDA